jgi:hypothetical protein
MKVRVTEKTVSSNVENIEDLALAAEMAIKVLKSEPMILGEPVAEVSSGCPMGFANPKVTVSYKIIDPSVYDRIKMFVKKQSIQDVIKNMRDYGF